MKGGGAFSFFSPCVQKGNFSPENSKNGISPFHMACYRGHLDVVTYLVVEVDLDPHAVDGLFRRVPSRDRENARERERQTDCDLFSDELSVTSSCVKAFNLECKHAGSGRTPLEVAPRVRRLERFGILVEFLSVGGDGSRV